MKLLPVILLISFALFLRASGQKSCKMVVADLTKRQLMEISKCVKSMGFKTGKEKNEKMTCVLKCVFKNFGVLNEAGYITKEVVQQILEKEFPENIRSGAQEVFMHCAETTGDKVDPNEELCKSYDPMIKCFLGGLGKVCPK